jgi:hypothetical protein
VIVPDFRIIFPLAAALDRILVEEMQGVKEGREETSSPLSLLLGKRRVQGARSKKYNFEVLGERAKGILVLHCGLRVTPNPLPFF